MSMRYGNIANNPRTREDLVVRQGVEGTSTGRWGGKGFVGSSTMVGGERGNVKVSCEKHL